MYFWENICTLVSIYIKALSWMHENVPFAGPQKYVTNSLINLCAECRVICHRSVPNKHVFNKRRPPVHYKPGPAELMSWDVARTSAFKSSCPERELNRCQQRRVITLNQVNFSQENAAPGQPAKASLHRRGGGGPLRPSANKRFIQHAVKRKKNRTENYSLWQFSDK